MKTFVKLKDGTIWILVSDNTREETMSLIPLKDCTLRGDYDVEHVTAKDFPYDMIQETDTNLTVLRHWY